MNLKTLRYFSLVAQLSSFSRAAEQLDIAQSAVSTSVKKLEQSLGLLLFERRDRSIKLTDEGRKLLHHAAVIQQAVADAELEMAELGGLQRGNVRIGIPGMLGSYHFPPILMAFRHRYPDLDLSVIEGGTWELQQMLEHGELDLGVIVKDFAPAELETRHFLQAEMLVVVHREHPFATRKHINVAEFFEQELVMFKEGYFHRKVVDQLAKDAGLKPNIGFETNLIPLIKQIIKQEFGVSTMLGMVVEDDPDLVTISFETPVWLNLCIAWRKDGYLSKANRAFMDFVLEQPPLPPSLE